MGGHHFDSRWCYLKLLPVHGWWLAGRIHFSSPVTTQFRQLFPCIAYHCRRLRQTDRPSFLLICCHSRRHPYGTDCTVLWLIHHDTLHSFICQNQARCHIQHVYWTVHLSEFLRACIVDFCHWGIFLSLPDANVEQTCCMDIISLSYTYTSCR